MIAQTRRKLAGQALIVGFPGATPPPDLLETARNGELGGFILFKRNVGPALAVADLCAELSAAFPIDRPPFISVDQEGGRVQRLGPPVLQLPPMRALGTIDDPDLTERVAFVLGTQLAALGFNLDFAPVLDVDSYADSPVIGDRSFGSEPELVGRHGRAFARGLSRAGVASCGKHFPGHGATTLDSHLALPRLSFDRSRLEQVELRPFRQLATDPELTAIMTAHIVVDALDADRPATLSAAALEGLLRDELGFRGLVISDDLEMKAIADNYGIGDAACQAVAAGCDVLLVCKSAELALEAQEALVLRAERDPSFERRLQAAFDRSLAVRRRYPIRARSADELHAELQASSGLQERIADALQRLATTEA
jgi:beta-N-acetylhexosaminidase